MTLSPTIFTALAWGAVALVLLVFLYVIYTVARNTGVLGAGPT